MSVVNPLVSSSLRTKVGIGIGAVVVVAAAFVVGRSGAVDEARNHDSATVGRGALVELVGDRSDVVRLVGNDSAATLGIRVAEIRPATGPQPLNLPGTLALDPSRLIHVHSRFGGEAIKIGTTDDGQGGVRPLRFGDQVTKGQLLAVVWSKEIGEKKSELMDAASLLEASKAISTRLEKLPAGVVTERSKEDARRDVEAALIAVAKAERTLRSWRMTDEEIAAIYAELKAIRKPTQDRDTDVEQRWAEIEVRAAIDGVVVEKGFNVGDMVESDDDLFKIADLSRLQVITNVYEEDLRAIRGLKPEERRWTIDLKSDPTDNRIPGTFDMIGSVIDPAQRTGTIIGWLDNKEGKLAVGQFITATISIPHDPNLVAIPVSALIEEGDSTSIFVEVDRARGEYARRRVAVVRRGVDTVYVDTAPGDDRDLRVRAGERVVVSGVLGLGGELAHVRNLHAKRG